MNALDKLELVKSSIDALMKERDELMERHRFVTDQWNIALSSLSAANEQNALLTRRLGGLGRQVCAMREALVQAKIGISLAQVYCLESVGTESKLLSEHYEWIKVALSSTGPCRHEEEAKCLREEK